MKKITFTLLSILSTLITFSQISTFVNVPNPNTNPGTSGLRGPNGTASHTLMKAQYFISQTELTAVSPTITSFGFVLTSGVNVAASGTFAIYLQNTPATSYTSGITYSTLGMTNVYTGTYNIPVGANAATIDFSFPLPFSYTGNGLNVAYEYTAAVTAVNPAIYTAFASTTSSLGATGSSTTTGVAPVLGLTAFRPVFRFGTPNTVTNDISVNYIDVTGIVPANTFTSQSIKALVTNNSNTVLTNVAVGYSVTGFSSLTGTYVLSSIAPGASTLLTLASYTIPLTASGLNNINVAVLPDQNNTNNSANRTTSLNCNTWSYASAVTIFSNTVVGFNTGSGIIFSKFSVPTSATLTAAKVAISSGTTNIGNTVYAVLADATGSTIANSNSVTLNAGNIGAYQTFSFAPQNISSGVNYHIGLAQTSNTLVGYFPVATYSTTNLPPNIYATASLINNTAVTLTTNLGYMGIQAQFAGTCTTTVGISEVLNLNSNLIVYPNPAVNGKTTIANLEGNNTITVYNMLGSVISTQKTTNSNVVIDLSSQATGNYFIKITDSNNATKALKVINQ